MPRGTMRVLAGSAPTPGTFWLARDIDPPEELERMVFSDVDLWLERLTGDKIYSTACDFLKMMQRLRRVVLQETALLRVKHPDHHIFRLPLSDTDLYKAYAERVIIASNTTTSPMDIQLNQVMPDMVRHVDVVRDLVVTSLRDLRSSFGQDIHTLAKELDQLVDQMETGRAEDQRVMRRALGNLSSGMHLLSTAVLETRMVFPDEITAPLPSPSAPAIDLSLASPTSTHALSAFIPASNNISTSASTSSARIFAALERAGRDGEGMFRAEGAAAGSRGDPAAVGQQANVQGDQGFVMEKDHPTAAALWREYDVGVLGRLSFREMISQDMKKAECQRKRWERRRKVIYEAERLAKERTTSPDSIARDLDMYTSREELTMPKLQDRINVARKAGETLPIWS